MNFKGVFRSKELKTALKKLPGAYEKNIISAQEKTAKEVLKYMRIFAPGDGQSSGELVDGMYIQRDDNDRRFAISVEAARPNKEDQIKAVAIHVGRRKGDRGTTVGVPYVGRARQLGTAKHKGRMTRALLKARKDVGLKK